MPTKLDNSLRNLAPSILRIGIALVFMWFGFQQLTDAASWLGYVPDSVVSLSHLTVTTLVHFNGAFEVLFGLALILGLFTRTTALLLTLHMADIAFIVGYTSIGVRDTGLTIAAFSIFFYGADLLSLDMLYLRNDKNRVE
ncbi:MAG: DoxX family membrane protein [bacterium]